MYKITHYFDSLLPKDLQENPFVLLFSPGSGQTLEFKTGSCNFPELQQYLLCIYKTLFIKLFLILFIYLLHFH